MNIFILSERCLYEVQKGALSSCGYDFFFLCGRTRVCMPNKKLHIFKAFKIVVFFPPCKYFYSLCEVVLSRCSVQVSVKVKDVD